MPFQSIISSPFFKAVSADSGAILATKTANCFSYGTVTEKKKTHASLGYKKREKERTGRENETTKNNRGEKKRETQRTGRGRRERKERNRESDRGWRREKKQRERGSSTRGRHK
jgi:hypothetical protein